MLIAGLDEAGRGPVIGSLCIGYVILEKENLDILDEIGVDDSKKITPKKRAELAIKIKEIAKYWNVLEITAEKINELHEQGLTLNRIEEIHFVQLINNCNLQPDEIFLDAADVNEERFGKTIGKSINYKPNKIISKHKGDSIFKIVGAASILAKFERDKIIERYKEVYGNIGSGYPSDPYTRKFLFNYFKDNGNFPPIVRTFWKTVENIKKEVMDKKNQKKQKKLDDF